MSNLTKKRKEKQNNYHTQSPKKKKKATCMPTHHPRNQKKKNFKNNKKWAFLFIKQPHFLYSVFSPFLGENFLVGPRRKHPGPTIYFPSFPPNQTHSKKFSFLFSLQSFPSILFHLQTNTPLRL